MKRILLTLGILFTFIVPPMDAKAQQATATLEFVPSTTQAKMGEEFTVDVMLKNPGLQNIISVRSWLEYDSEALEGVSVNTDTSPFTLSAPGENEFSAEEGLLKIGRSNVAGGFNQAEAKVATVYFKVKTSFAASSEIKPYDYQTTELGHTSVNIIDQGFPVNILAKEPSTISLGLNSGSPNLGVGGEKEVSIISNLNRPQGVKITTGSGYVDLKWTAEVNPEIKGYNIYYGKTSGQYTRQRTLNLLNEYRLEGLNNGEVYYFAVTSYDLANKESDYSDEVAIIINQPLSSTSPFEAFTSSKLNDVPVTPQNGPLLGWLGFSALGLGAVLAFRNRKTNSSSCEL